MKLINKTAVVAELKRRIQESIDAGGATSGVYLSERMKEDSYILSFLDTLAVKELDLDSEIDRVWNETSDSFTSDCWLEFENIARHFFELGLNTQKGE